MGCRELHTRDLLEASQVPAYVSHCLTLLFPRRYGHSADKIIVSSRDERILKILPDKTGPCHYVEHYSNTADFDANLVQAQELIEYYRTHARMVITTLLHCALPCLAMGIPVIMFYPDNQSPQHESDQERFSSLREHLRIYRFDEVAEVDWNPRPLPVASLKLHLNDILQNILNTLSME